jgi:hypothetical protein
MASFSKFWKIAVVGALLVSSAGLLVGCSDQGDDGTSMSPTAIGSRIGDKTLAFTMTACGLDLPVDPVGAVYDYPGAHSFFEITLSGIVGDFDVTNGVYAGWCAEPNRQDNSPDPVLLLCTYDTGLPGNLGSVSWDLVNYVLNHKQGSWFDVQLAIWQLIWGDSHRIPTEVAWAMVADAQANGPGFMPGPGQLIAIILCTGDEGIGPDGWQDTIIEVPVPEDGGGGEGCTPGYWKNHEEDWPATGYALDDDFDTVFGVDFWESDITLYEAVWARGGGVNKASRHATAALLSAAHPDVDYPFTEAEVIALLRDGDIETLVDANELGCDLP